SPRSPARVSGYTLPEGWALASLDEISYDSGYGTSVKCDYSGTGSPVLRIPNIQSGVVDANDMKYAVDATVDLSSYFIGVGDLLFVRTNGSPDLIGRVGIANESIAAA